MIRLIGFFLARSRWRFTLAVALAVLSAAATVAVVAIATRTVTGLVDGDGGATSPPLTLGLTFVVAVVVAMLARMQSRNLLQDVTAALTTEVRLGLARSALLAPYERMEATGTAHLTTALHSDVTLIGASLQSLSIVINNMIIVIGIFLYMAWLSPLLCLGTLAISGVGIAGYWLLSVLGSRHVAAAQLARNQLFRHLDTVVRGLKELKLNTRRRHDLMALDVEPVAGQFVSESRLANHLFNLAVSCGQVCFFAILGIIGLVLPSTGLFTPGILASFAILILYVLAPIETSLNQIASFAGAAAAVDRIGRLGLTVDTPAARLIPADPPPPPAPGSVFSCRGLSYAYPGAEGADGGGFAIGPLDLDFRPGRITIIAGGNGSGKTTLAKLLTGLYRPTAGYLAFADERVDDATLDRHRSRISAAFVDTVPFARLPGPATPELLSRARNCLASFDLAGKVQLGIDGFSTVTALSKGQQQRLLLAGIDLENRHIAVFDEWAANQDVEFKRAFYETYLPGLRDQGKIVIVISHDLHVFHIADDVIWLEDGKVAPLPEGMAPSRRPAVATG
ncbi:ATP-binding cassette domain-containing protein [Tistrella sp. BH-R2-4]|uniref:ATP-binding cassette domain-containing protein n=1 Tax=Tistrella arctica TaxID=3133430 RepID=A0ABU9YM12_9PROT